MNAGITADIVAPVEGLFFDLDAGLDARNKFADYLASTGAGDWLYSEGAMHEWTVGFYKITDVRKFETEVLGYMKQIGVTSYRIVVRDAESPRGNRL